MKNRSQNFFAQKITNFFRNEQGFIVVSKSAPNPSPKATRNEKLLSPDHLRWHITAGTAAYSMPVAAFNSQLG